MYTLIRVIRDGFGNFGYLDIVNLIFEILFGIFTLAVIHFAAFAIAGFLKRKKFPKTDVRLRYGVVVSARNEATVIGNLIKSVRQCNYPQDKIDIFVVAHNCQDNTAEIARACGANVYEYNNPDEATKGYAFRHLFSMIERDHGITSYDGFLVLDADNILSENYIEKMNEAFVAGDKKDVITSYRHSKNFGSNYLSACYGLYFLLGCRFEASGRTILGCSTRIQGTGYIMNSEYVKEGWKYVTLTEDWEFTADLILKNVKIKYCDAAIFYDEQPTGLGVMFRQRVRWARGHLLVCTTRFKDLLRGLVRRKSKGGSRQKGSTYDIFINISPVFIITTVLSIAKYICIALAPVFYPEVYDFGYLAVNELWWAGFSFLVSYLGIVVIGIILYITEHKRIKGVSLPMKIVSVLCFPIFLLTFSSLCEIVSIFVRKLGWKPIPHKDAIGIDEINALGPVDESDTSLEADTADTAEEKEAVNV